MVYGVWCTAYGWGSDKKIIYVCFALRLVWMLDLRYWGSGTGLILVLSGLW